MKLSISKIGLILMFLLFGTTLANAQFANSNHKKKKFIVAMGGGASIMDFSRMNMLGGNITLEGRQPLYHFGKKLSLSLNATIIASFGNSSITGEKDKFLFLPAGLLTLNINAFSQSTKADKDAFGGFLGAGLLLMPSHSITYDKYDEEVTETSGMMGPGMMAGPRFRLGKTFMDLRIFGGILLGGDTEFTYAGVNLMFTFGMGRSGRFGMQ